MARVHHPGKAAVGLLFGALLLGGYGAAKAPAVIESASIIVTKDGKVTSYAVGVFDKEYYNLQGLRMMVKQEAAAYNAAHQIGTKTPVTVKGVRTQGKDGSTVVASFRYNSADTYAAYNKTPFFYGTVEQAKKKYNFQTMNQVMFEAQGDKSIVSSRLTEADMEKRHVIMVEEPTYVYCPYKVAYISEDARMLSDDSVDTTGVDAEFFPVIILMNK